MPVYVNYGVADLGFSGSDVVYEGDFEFLHLARLPFGGTKICVAGYEKDRPLFEQNGLERNFIKPIKIATKFTRFTNHYFEERGIPVQIIKLTGSVELGRTHVKLIANPSLYRQNYRKIDDFVSKLQG